MPNILNVIDADHALQTAEAKLGQTHVELAPFLNALGTSYVTQGLYEDALRCYSRALELKRRNEQVDDELRNLVHKQGVLHRVRNNFADAERCYTEALDLARQLYGEDSLQYAEQNNYLSGLYYRCALYDLAERSMLRSIALYEKLSGIEPETLGLCHFALALIKRRGGHEDEAQKEFKQAKRLLANIPWELHFDVEVGLVALAVRNFEEKNDQQVEELFRHYIVAGERLWPYSPLITDSYYQLADYFMRAGDTKSSEACYLAALKNQEEMLEPSCPQIVETLKRLAILHLDANDNEKAMRYMKQALGIKK
ncbi:MAG TPA: tetratricopeptide repeat protein [Candidatus Obscuribacterales bacterium]